MNDTIIFLVLAGLALLFKWLTKQGSGDREEAPPPPPNEPVQRAAPLTEEERVRRFLEALGVPAGTQPPPPVRPRTVTPRPAVARAPQTPPKIRRSWAQPLPPVVTTPKETPPPLTTAWQPEPVFVVELPAAPEGAVPPPPPAEVKAPLPAAPPVRKLVPARTVPLTSLGAALRSREKIRQAIILREILGPPRGLEPFGQLQGQ